MPLGERVGKKRGFLDLLALVQSWGATCDGDLLAGRVPRWHRQETGSTGECETLTKLTLIADLICSSSYYPMKLILHGCIYPFVGAELWYVLSDPPIFSHFCCWAVLLWSQVGPGTCDPSASVSHILGLPCQSCSHLLVFPDADSFST